MDIKEVGQKISKLFSGFFRMVNPVPEVGGLEISDIALRYVRRAQGKIFATSLRLPPGIVQEGVIKDETNFLSALRKLHAQVVGNAEKKEVYVIVSLPSEMVYSQVFDVPVLKDESLENAVRLNLEMISPLKRGESYSAYEQVGTRQDDGFQLEFLGAFAESERVDRVERSLFDAGFVAVAAEFPGLSLSRVVQKMGKGIDPAKPFIVVDVATTGINFLVIRNNNLYFQYHVSWKQVSGEGGNITASALRDLIQHNLQQVLNFHLSRWGTRAENVVIIAPGLKEAIKKIINENFHLNLVEAVFAEAGQLAPEYYVALGAALRGEGSRVDDMSVSLLRVGTKDEFLLTQTMNFVNFWRTLVVTVVLFLLIIFTAGDALIAVAQRTIRGQNERIALTPDVNDLEKFQAQANQFNDLVGAVRVVKGRQYAWSEFFGRLNALAAGSGVVLTRVYYQSPSVPILLNGSGPNEEAVLSFKNKLSAEKNVQSVDLPLTNLSSLPTGTSFNLRFVFTGATTP